MADNLKFRVMAMNATEVDFAERLRESVADFAIVEDEKRNAFDTWQRMLASVGDSPAVFMEDDIILSDGFEREVVKAIYNYPQDVITFFTLKRTGSLPEYRAGSTFCMNQCYYLPMWVAEDIYEYSKRWIASERGKEHPTGYDYCMADYFKVNKMKYLLWHKSLVQHKEQKSRIDPRRSSRRQAKNFRG